MLSLLHVLWNALIPWRRRRRYYFLRVLPRVAALHQDPDFPDKPISETVLSQSMGMPLGAFADTLAGRAVPPALIAAVGRLAYKIAPPTWWTVYGPCCSLALGAALVLGLILLGVL